MDNDVLILLPIILDSGLFVISVTEHLLIIRFVNHSVHSFDKSVKIEYDFF